MTGVQTLLFRSCKCKRYSRQHNESGHKTEAQPKEEAPQGSRRRKDKRRELRERERGVNTAWD